MNRPIRGLVGAVLLLHGFARSEVDPIVNRSDGNHVIPERNAFGLKATTPTRAAGETVEPLEDLVLNGVIEVATCRQAVFMLVEPGKAPSFFTVREGEQNQWLEVRSVNGREGTVKVVLKKPLASVRTVGVEVVFSFEAAGRKRRTADLNRGNPHVDIPEGSTMP